MPRKTKRKISMTAATKKNSENGFLHLINAPVRFLETQKKKTNLPFGITLNIAAGAIGLLFSYPYMQRLAEQYAGQPGFPPLEQFSLTHMILQNGISIIVSLLLLFAVMRLLKTNVQFTPLVHLQGLFAFASAIISGFLVMLPLTASLSYLNKIAEGDITTMASLGSAVPLLALWAISIMILAVYTTYVQIRLIRIVGECGTWKAIGILLLTGILASIVGYITSAALGA